MRNKIISHKTAQFSFAYWNPNTLMWYISLPKPKVYIYILSARHVSTYLSRLRQQFVIHSNYRNDINSNAILWETDEKRPLFLLYLQENNCSTKIKNFLSRSSNWIVVYIFKRSYPVMKIRFRIICAMCRLYLTICDATTSEFLKIYHLSVLRSPLLLQTTYHALLASIFCMISESKLTMHVTNTLQRMKWIPMTSESYGIHMQHKNMLIQTKCFIFVSLLLLNANARMFFRSKKVDDAIQ